MAGFDTSNVAADGPVNPFGIVNDIAATQNTLNQNKAFQAKALAGQYLEQSTGSDGQPDLGKFSAMLQRDPRTAPFAQEALQGVASLRQTGIQNQTQQAALAQARRGYIMQDAATFGNVSQDPRAPERNLANQKSAMDALTRGIQTGRYGPDDVSSFVANGGLNDAITAATISGAGSENAMEARYGKPTVVNTGGNIEAVNQNRVRGTQDTMSGNAANIPVTLTPEAKIARTPTVGPNNEPTTTPIGAINTDTGDIKPNNGITNPQGVVQSGLSPGVSAAVTATGQTAADLANHVTTAFQGSANRESLYKEALSALDDFRAGPGSSNWSKGVNEVNRLFGTNISPTATPAQQVYQKITEQLAALSRPVMGLAPTNEQIELSKNANPNTEMSDESARRMIALGLGNEKLIQAQNNAWLAAQKKGYGVTDFPHFQAQFNSLNDPRWFQYQYMTDHQKQEITKNMTDKQLKQFNSGVNYVNGKDYTQ